MSAAGHKITFTINVTLTDGHETMCCETIVPSKVTQVSNIRL